MSEQPQPDPWREYVRALFRNDEQPTPTPTAPAATETPTTDEQWRTFARALFTNLD